MPLVFARNPETGEQKWTWIQWPEPRPLYLNGAPDTSRVAVVVEGVKLQPDGSVAIWWAGSAMSTFSGTRTLDAQTLPASIWMTVPTMLAMFVGYRVHDRLDQEVFRKATLVVLVLTGLNLLRRSMF